MTITCLTDFTKNIQVLQANNRNPLRLPMDETIKVRGPVKPLTTEIKS